MGDGHTDWTWRAELSPDHRGGDTPAVLHPYPARRSSLGCYTLLVLAGFAAAAAVGMILLVTSVYHRVIRDIRAPAGSVPSSPGWAAGDVTVTCASGAASGPLTASVTVVNHGSDAADYLVAVEFSDGPGTSIGGGAARTDTVPPGGTTTITATGIAGPGTPDPSSCTASDVIRTIASGAG